MAIDFYPVEGLPFRPLAHVGEEIFKGIKPAITHLDAPPAVMAIMGILRNGASSLRSLPRSVCWAWTKMVGATVFELTRTKLLPMKASAACCGTRCKLVTCFRYTRAAIAKANPLRPSALRCASNRHVPFNHSKPAVTVLSAINEGAHRYAFH